MAVDIDVVIENGVRVIGGGGSRFGVSLDTFVGNINENGEYTANTDPIVFNGDGIKQIAGIFAPNFTNVLNLVGFYMNDLEIITDEALMNMCAYSGVVDFGLDSLVEIKYAGAMELFSGCPLTEAHVDNLVRIDGDNAAQRMFAGHWDGSSVLKKARMNSLEYISGYYAANSLFAYNHQLDEILLPKLRVVRGEMAGYFMLEQTALKTYTFESLEEATGRACLAGLFDNCPELESVYFPKLKIVEETVFSERYNWSPDYPYQNAFGNCPKLREIHFRADMEDVIKGLFGYAQKWGAEQAQIIFDL
jgi:hypothetical protein